ncbi:unnamed protein product [Camellia sinensis]
MEAMLNNPKGIFKLKFRGFSSYFGPKTDGPGWLVDRVVVMPS